MTEHTMRVTSCKVLFAQAFAQISYIRKPDGNAGSVNGIHQQEQDKTTQVKGHELSWGTFSQGRLGWAITNFSSGEEKLLRQNSSQPCGL